MNNCKKNWQTDLLNASLEDFKEYFKYLTIEKKSSSSSIRIDRFAIEYYRNEITFKEYSPYAKAIEARREEREKNQIDYRLLSRIF